MQFDQQTMKEWIEARMSVIWRADPLSTYLNAALEGARLALSEAERVVPSDVATRIKELREGLK